MTIVTCEKKVSLIKSLSLFSTTIVRQCRRFTISFPESSLFLPRESTLVSAGHVAPKIWVLTRMCYRGGVAKCKIVTSVRMVESTGGGVSFFRNIRVDKNSFYRQVFLRDTQTFDIEAVHVIFDSEKHVYKSLNFKTLSLTIAIVNGSRHESQHNKFTTRRAVGFMLYAARNEMECQGLGRTNLFWHLQGAAECSATIHKIDKRRDGKIRLNTPRQPTETTVLVRI